MIKLKFATTPNTSIQFFSMRAQTEQSKPKFEIVAEVEWIRLPSNFLRFLSPILNSNVYSCLHI